jgi:hypothetical protein
MMPPSATRNCWEGPSAYFKAFVMLAASVLMTTGCSDQTPVRAAEKKRENPWTKGTPISEIKFPKEREVMLRGSIDQLQQIAAGLRLANQLNGQFPGQLNAREIVAKPESLLSPIDLLAKTPEMPLGFGAWPIDNQWNWAITNCSYAYIPGQKEADAANILLYEKPKPRKNELPVYFMDGKVKLASADQLAGLLKKQQDTGKLTDADRQPLAEPPPKMK